jgi:hypothetical protein
LEKKLWCDSLAVGCCRSLHAQWSVTKRAIASDVSSRLVTYSLRLFLFYLLARRWKHSDSRMCLQEEEEEEETNKNKNEEKKQKGIIS